MEVLSGGGKGKSDVLSGNTGGDYSILINTSEDNEKEVSVTDDVRTGPFYHWEYQVVNKQTPYTFKQIILRWRNGREETGIEKVGEDLLVNTSSMTVMHCFLALVRKGDRIDRIRLYPTRHLC